jgi:hypothetical protein
MECRDAPTERFEFTIAVEGRRITGKFNSKSLRRAVAAAQGGDVVVIVQGKLEAGDILVDAGISAQPRAKKEAGIN